MRHALSKPWHGLYRLGYTLFYRDGTSIFFVLRVADFRNLWIGQMISFLGDALAFNTITLAIIQMANDADVEPGKYIGTLAVLSALPPLLLGMVAGTVVDRVNRKTTMIVADILRGFLALGFLLVHDLDHVWIFFVVSVSLSTVSVFFFPARTAILPAILDKGHLLSANAMAQLTYTLSFVTGAGLAGFMVGYADATAPAFIADSLSFFISAYFIARISISGQIVAEPVRRATDALQQAARSFEQKMTDTARTVRAMTGELIVGVHYVFTDQVMRGVLISFLALMLGLGAANVTFVPLLINELGMEEEGLGLIRLSQNLGIILGSAAIASIASRYKARDLIGLSMLAFGIMTLIVSVVGNYTLIVAVLFFVGLTISPPQIVAPTLIQRHVPKEKLGRASGAQNTIVTVANIVSMAAAGYLMDEIGARPIFAISGSLIFCAGIVSWWVLRGVEDLEDANIKEIPGRDPDPADASSESRPADKTTEIGAPAAD
jgi:DHA3 family macrolide efflux protein-like MFS transporter